MYKIKESSANNIIIKFPKQNEVNYNIVCTLNELQDSAVLPFTFSLKLFKVQMVFDTSNCTKFSDIIRKNNDENSLTDLLCALLSAIDSLANHGINKCGIIYRTDCIYIDSNNRIRFIYAPCYEFDTNNNLFMLGEEMISVVGGNPMLNEKIRQIIAAYSTGNINTASSVANAPAGMDNEGETTVLSSAPRSVSNEGETTVLSPKPPVISNEGETTVLSPSMSQPAAEKSAFERVPTLHRDVPEISVGNEGETTVLSNQKSEPAGQSDFSEGETTVLSPAMNVRNESADDSKPESADDFNEYATCLIDDDSFDDFSDLHHDDIDDEQEEAHDYSERETSIPGFADPLNSNRTLIGADGLAQAMAYSAIQPNEKAADNYETVLMTDNSSEKTAFFIRFINSQAVYITKNYFSIGSGSDMDYVISGNSLISKYHATVVIEDSRYYIIDNNSTNKVYVDGREAAPFEKNEIFTGSRVVLANEIFDFYIK